MKITHLEKIKNVKSLLFNDIRTAYIIDTSLHYLDGAILTLPTDTFVWTAAQDKNNFYATSKNQLYQIKGTDFRKACPVEAVTFYGITDRQVIAKRKNENGNFDSYFIDKEEIWTKPSALMVLAYNERAIATLPDFKGARIDFRDLSTFEVVAEIRPEENYNFLRMFNNTYNDNLIVIQREKTKENKLQEIIATSHCMLDGKELWKTEYKGSHSLIFNEQDNIYYGLFSRYEREGRMLYFNSLNAETGKANLEIVEKNTEISAIPWLASINNNIMYLVDPYLSEGGAVVAFDLLTKTILTRCYLGLKKGVQLHEPHVRDNKIYVLDTANNLHIMSITA
jgi:hypothetical protein